MYTDPRVGPEAIEVWFYAFGTKKGGNWCSEPAAHRRTETFRLRIAASRFKNFVERKEAQARAIPSADNRRFASSLRYLLSGGGLALYKRIQPMAERGL